MTLEKLLILGFAIAVVTAITVTARGMVEDKEEPYTNYQDKVSEIVEQAN